MKKVITIIIMFLFIFIYLIILLNNNKEVKVYTIPKNISIYKTEGRYFNVDLYQNNNQDYLSHAKLFLKGSKTFSVDDYYVEDLRKDKYYIKRIWINCNNLSFNNDDLYLIIQSVDIELECYVGKITVYEEKYELLEFSDLYGNYAKIDNGLYLVGITISLGRKYQVVEKVEIGSCYGILSEIKAGVLYPPEIKDYDFSLDNNSRFYKLDPNERYYFIPIGYDELLFIDNCCIIFTIDNKKYLLDNFYYFGSEIIIDNYKNIVKEGKIKCLS